MWYWPEHQLLHEHTPPRAQAQHVCRESGIRWQYLGGIGIQLQLQGHECRATAVRKLLLRFRVDWRGNER